MKSSIVKDRKRRKLVEGAWVDRMKRKVIKEDIRKGVDLRMEASKALSDLSKWKTKDVYMSRVRNRCVMTGNPRSVIRWFRMSGLMVREVSRKGMIPGVYKKSW